MNANRLLEELLSRQIPFSIRDGFLFVSSKGIEDLQGAIDEHGAAVAQLLNEEFVAKNVKKALRVRRTTVGFSTTFPIPSPRPSVLSEISSLIPT
jgi:hypothetical protein